MVLREAEKRRRRIAADDPTVVDSLLFVVRPWMAAMDGRSAGNP